MFINVLNRNLVRIFVLIKRFTKNKYWSTYFADRITISLNRIIRNEFIPNPKEHLYIEVTNICNFRCKFCAYSKTTNNKVIMSNDTFFNIINEATNFGYDTFGLTPIVGEVFVDKNFMEKINFLEKHLKVKNYSFFTNFSLANEVIIDDLIKTKKLDELFISLYGHDKESFLKFTSSNEKSYDTLITNLKYLLKRIKEKNHNFKLSFGLRTYQSFDSIKNCESELCQVVKKLLRASNNHILINKTYYNWGGYISQEDVSNLDIIINKGLDLYKKGACSLIFYKNQVLADCRINACACRDVDATLAIGDLKYQKFKEIYSKRNNKYIKIISNQQKGKFNRICTYCDFYRSIYKNYEVYEKYRKNQMNLSEFYQYLI